MTEDLLWILMIVGTFFAIMGIFFYVEDLITAYKEAEND